MPALILFALSCYRLLGGSGERRIAEQVGRIYLQFLLNLQSLPPWRMYGNNKTVAESKLSQDRGCFIGKMDVALENWRNPNPTPCPQRVTGTSCIRSFAALKAYARLSHELGQQHRTYYYFFIIIIIIIISHASIGVDIKKEKKRK